jgi:GNAT superfamily N-acetyltransferase
MTEPQVRVASLADEAELFKLVKAWHAEEGLASFDDVSAYFMLRRLLEGAGVIGIIGTPGKMEASISLLPGRMWYSPQSTLESLWNYVYPAFRKSANAKALANFAKRQAKLLGIPLLLDVISTKDNAPKLALYERVFGPRAGAAFHYQPKPEDTDIFEGTPVRTAGIEDKDELFDICREAHRESGSFEADEGIAAPVIEAELQGPGAVIGVIGKPGAIEATISFHTARMWYSSDPLIEERWAYVREAHRRSNNAKNLIAFAKRQAVRLNVPLRIGVITRKETEQKVRLYQRLLGEPSGAYFLYRADN